MEIEASATEVFDEVCNDSEYESRSTDDDPNAKPISVEVQLTTLNLPQSGIGLSVVQRQ
jgi:hypothetical protein